MEQISFRLPAALLWRLRQRAAAERRRVPELLRLLIEDGLETLASESPEGRGGSREVGRG